MSREILFRGKLPNGDWLYGTPVTERSGKVMMYTPDEHGYVDPATVGQYTGLTDKNGVKIFEGDIVKFPEGRIGEIGSVVYHVPDCAFFIVESQHGDFVRMDDFDSSVEVIGNVHDNPELLEVTP